MNLDRIRRHMATERLDGWLIYDFRGSSPVLSRLLGKKRWTTRRVYLFIPAEGEGEVGQPRLLVHTIDDSQFADCDTPRDGYLRWQQIRAWLETQLRGRSRIAMEYAPGCTLPVVSVTDAGTIEAVRACGVDVVSSANMIQACIAAWTDAQREGHRIASEHVARVKDEAFELIGDRINTGGAGDVVTEREITDFILARFEELGLETDDVPVVAVNDHAGDPHYHAPETGSAPIRRGDWVLIDLWARLPGDDNIFADITWVGCVGQPSNRQEEVFNAVKAARDASILLAQQRWREGRPVMGWELDEAAAAVLREAGLESRIRHRTGHSLSAGPMVHGIGMNLDNLETHDTRLLLPRLGFTVEPGAYLSEFGVRLEINAWVHPQTGPEVTSCVQEEIVEIG